MLPKPAKGEAPILSFAQERVWFLQQLEPNNPAYNRPLAMRLRGSLVIEALESALTRIQERHETLRTIVGSKAGRPTLHISDTPLVNLRHLDLSRLPTQARSAALIEELQHQAQLVFTLQGEPIFRANLVRLAQDDHVLSLVFHHLVFDRWSEEVFRNELGQLYQAQLQNQPNPLAELKAQYVDFARWQKSWVESEAGQQQNQYWQQRLEGDLPVLKLPIDARRPLQRSHAASSVFFNLNSDLSRLIEKLSRRSNVTEHTTLLAAFLVLLHRYSSQDDIVIGIPTAGRMLPETEPMIGLFINSLAARYDLSGNPSAEDILQRVSRTTLRDLSHQDYPFELVVQALNPSRDMRTTPLFQVMFNYENVPRQAVSFEPLTIETINYDPGLAQFDLTLEIEDRRDQYRCGLSFNQDIFESTTIERMAGHYRTILEGFVFDLQSTISDLPLLTQPELRQLSTNRRAPNPPMDASDNLKLRFEAQVKRTPRAVAVEFEGETLTYAALNIRANQLAHTLIEADVHPDQLIGLCLEPSLNMVVGILGILKAGGAYVPLDPEYPRQRLQFMLDDGNLDLVISEKAFHSKITRPESNILALDAEADRIAAMPEKDPQVDVTDQNLAYAMYTSGSTGKPKGVLLTHRNVIQLFDATVENCQFGPEDIWPLFHSFTFDFSVFEFFGALLYGGRLIVIPVSMRKSLDTFFSQVVFKRVTILAMIPPLFFQAARMSHFYDRLHDSNLRQIFLGGDELEVARLGPFFEEWKTQTIRLFNIYGPTETTVFATWHEVTPGDMHVSLGSVIGWPLKSVGAYILDNNLNLLPMGVPGEIVIGGLGVARGYLNRPELNQERFIEHPIDPRADSRFYRTGDRGRIRSDGELEFLGRLDTQMKLRGFRVEPGEIEAALQSHPAVAEAVVKVVEGGEQDKILAAYLVFKEDQSFHLPEMRAFLSGMLPDYMIPTAMMKIEFVPLTPVGKVDRKALPDLGPRERGLQTAMIEPETELEHSLQLIWQQVLEQPEVGVTDNFFNLGGHSLLALQLVARVRDQLEVELNVQDVFGKGQTIAGMAEMIELRRWLASSSEDQATEADQDQEQGRL